jgi:Flp pilus assembly protein TadD
MYLKLIVWPWPLLIHYQLPYLTTFTDSWMYVFPVLLLGLATLVLLWRNHPAGFLGACVFALLAPTFLVPILSEMAAERRVYLPLAAIVTVLVMGGYMLASRVSSRRDNAPKSSYRLGHPMGAIGFLTLAVAIAFGLISANRLGAYDEEINLWKEVLVFQPDNHVAHQNFGFYLDKVGKVSEAIEHYREAVRLSPDSAQAHYSLGLLLLKSGRAEDAVKDFQDAAHIMAKDASVQNNLAVALFMAGRNDESIAAFEQTLQLDPDRWAARCNLGLALQKAGRYLEALRYFEDALKTNPKALDIYSEVANTYALMNQREKAIATLEYALQIARKVGDTENINRFTERINANR